LKASALAVARNLFAGAASVTIPARCQFNPIPMPF
jgi:hypothetical protein